MIRTTVTIPGSSRPMDFSANVREKVSGEYPCDISERAACDCKNILLTPFPEKGFRTHEVILVTSPLDPATLSVDDLADIYLERWRVELFKTTMHMNVLRTKSPQMICRELLMHMIAYNLIRALIMRTDADTKRASFKGTADRLGLCSCLLMVLNRSSESLAIVDQLLQAIAHDLNPLRPNRKEPCAVKRRPKNYQLLTAPRHQIIEDPHRNRYIAKATI